MKSVLRTKVECERVEITSSPYVWVNCFIQKRVHLACSSVQLLSCVRLFATPWTAACEAPPSMGFSRQEYWSGLPLPSPELLVVHISRSLLIDHHYRDTWRHALGKCLKIPGHQDSWRMERRDMQKRGSHGAGCFPIISAPACKHLFPGLIVLMV